MSAKRFVIESNIPSADSITSKQFGRDGTTTQQRREREDITAWMQLQEDAELDLLTQELTTRNSRNTRSEYSTYD